MRVDEDERGPHLFGYRKPAVGILRDANAMSFRTQCLLDDVKNRAAVINDKDVEASGHARAYRIFNGAPSTMTAGPGAAGTHPLRRAPQRASAPRHA